MKRLRRFSALIICMLLALASSMTVFAEEGYTYNYDYWGEIQYSPDAYSVQKVYTAADMGLEGKLTNPQGLNVIGNMIYICDTGNNRIIELERVDQDTIDVVRVIDSFQGAEPNTFSAPTDVDVTEDGYMFICDSGNQRILKLDLDLNFIMEFTKPQDSNFDPKQSFIPTKLSVDTAGRVYCIATNVNQGLIKFENDGEFSGFVGATKVLFKWTDYIWKRLATQEQRAQMVSFVPTEYDNLYIDPEGFVFVCTMNVNGTDLDSGDAVPIRRLNMLGNDILIQNGEWNVIGDIIWEDAGGYNGPSLIVDITAMENKVYVALDKVRGRLFAYDDQGRMLFAFGGAGNMDGYFRQPAAIEHMDHDLLVLDSVDASLTLFTPTEYGSLIYQAIEQFQDGYYTESGESWQKVLDRNGNNDLAYIGIGRSLLRQGKYHESMEYFKLKYDEDNYSKAFKQYRKEWVEDHIVVIFLIVFLVLCVPLAIGRVKKVKAEIDRADIFKV